MLCLLPRLIAQFTIESKTFTGAMMNQYIKRLITPGIAVLATAGAAILFATHPPVSSADMAAWIQAAGSIIAIGIAIYIPYHQRKIEFNISREKYWSEKADSEHRILLALEAIKDFADRMTFRLQPVPNGVRRSHYEKDEHALLLDRLDSLEARNLGDSGLTRIEACRKFLAEIHRLFDQVGSTVEINPGDDKKLSAIVEISSKIDSTILETIQQLARSRKAEISYEKSISNKS
ncbi:hypothetical protein [Burkholderia gladioli]|uniref:hypothetical protein n=1 Tax=Burkholderia gladioli TaxID=28095 RepID=UPI00163F1176|nr:hypothetical protein [Burkholderia gladioli]